MVTISVIALVLSIVSCVLASIAWARSGGREQLARLRKELESEAAALRARQQALVDDLSQRMSGVYQELIARTRRAQMRLAEARERASLETRRRAERLNEQLAELRHRAEQALARVKSEVGSGAQAAQEKLRRQLRDLEAHVQLLLARSDIADAEERAEEGDFGDAEVLLEDAVGKLRESRNQLDDPEDEAHFNEAIADLQKAIQSIRARAQDYRRQIDEVVTVSDSLLSSLERREQATM